MVEKNTSLHRLVCAMKLSRFFKLSFGNIIEWYDFSLYIYFATFIAVDFFPSHNPFVSTLLTFATFFLGSIVRPLGGLLAGWFADRYGYRQVINICIIVMGIATFAVAITPSYQQIGIAAPFILIALRILQGLSVGGQFPTLITLGTTDYQSQQGTAVGWMYSISTMGFLIASVIGFILTSTSWLAHDSLIWRAPFALSIPLLLIYLWINRHENSVTTAQPKHKNRSVFKALLQQWPACMGVICLTTMCASLYFLVFTYLVNYQIQQLHIPAHQAFLLNTGTLLIACCLYPLFGHLSMRWGQQRCFIIAMVLLILTSYPLLLMIQTRHWPWILAALLGFTVLMTVIQGAISPYFSKSFDYEWRATGCAFAYSVGNGISGGAPLAAVALVHYAPNLGLGVFILLLVAVGLLGIKLINHQHAHSLAAPSLH